MMRSRLLVARTLLLSHGVQINHPAPRCWQLSLVAPSMPNKKKDDTVAVESYWGVTRTSVTKEDGSAWPWNCFMVREQKRRGKKNIHVLVI